MKKDDAPSYQAVNNTLYTRLQKKKGWCNSGAVGWWR